MINTFLQYFEERAKTANLFYHVTSGDNLNSIKSQGLVPNRHSNFEGGTKSFSGIYVAKNLKELIANALDWDIVETSNFGLVVIESRGFTQLFMDEDNIINNIPTFEGGMTQAVAMFDKFVSSGFKESKLLNVMAAKFITTLREKFEINKHQYKLLRDIIIQNYPVLMFRDYISGIESSENLQKFLNHYGFSDMEDWFRGVIDKLTKLKLKFRDDPSGFDMDSARIVKPIGYSGNPKIVSLLRFKKNSQYPDIIYNRLSEDVLDTVSNVVQPRLDNY